MSDWLADAQNSGDDLDPRLIHRLEPLGLLLGILLTLARGDLIP